ncbi:MAG: DUF58 domain-containing protein [Planctomycetota bacterium]
MTTRRPWPQPTAAGWILLSAALSVGLLRPAGGLCDLLLGGLLALWIGGFVLARRAGLERIEVRRRAPRASTKGEAERVVHELLQPGPRALRHVFVREWTPAEERAADERDDPTPAQDCASFFPELLPGVPSEARARLFLPRRGRTRLRGVTLQTTDPFGLFQVERRVALPGEVLVRPRPRQVEGRWALQRARPRGVGGRSPAEWSAVRDWRAGDALRQVSWRLTARRGFPVVRVSPAQRAPLSLLVLDRRSGTRAGDFERAVSLAAGVGLRLLAEGGELRLLAPGAQGVELRRLRGAAGATRLLEALALVATDREGLLALDPAEPLEEAVLVTARRLGAGEARRAGLVLEAPRLVPGGVVRAERGRQGAPAAARRGAQGAARRGAGRARRGAAAGAAGAAGGPIEVNAGASGAEEFSSTSAPANEHAQAPGEADLGVGAQGAAAGSAGASPAAAAGPSAEAGA